MAMDLQNLDTNIYLLSTLFGAVDIPAKIAAYLMLRYSGGRNRSLVTFQVLAGLSILASVFVPAARQSLRVTFVVFAAGCLSAGITCIFAYGMELYPTVLRMTATGTDQVAARLGCILGPVFKITGQSFSSLPYIIYGASLLISGVAVFLLLPETQNVPLPDTIQDVENNIWKKSRHGRRQERIIVKSTQF
ncbi:solute carrier family 22 member 12-like [Monodelphis domestica]|nr:solute carrier family 22 member 12-like [Monodelphis domestica]